MDNTSDKNRKKPQAPDYKPYPQDEDIYLRNEKKSMDKSGEDWEEDEEYQEDPEDYDDNADQESNFVEDDFDAENDAEAPFGDKYADEDFPPEFQRMTDTPEDDDWNTENFDTDHTGDDLDVPGSELDDDQEEIGSEDEENNYYSLGGPDKDD